MLAHTWKRNSKLNLVEVVDTFEILNGDLLLAKPMFGGRTCSLNSWWLVLFGALGAENTALLWLTSPVHFVAVVESLSRV